MKTNYPVHPLADIFPMMPEDELAALAADIKANGLIHPIMLDKDGELLVDGRNRLKACKLAGVEPHFERLNGLDPISFIFSSNDRRDMTQGQRAVVAALAMTNLYKLYKFGAVTDLARSLKVPHTRVSEAIIIVKHAPDLAEQVRKGDMPFQPALEKARRLKIETETNAEKMERLRREAPDLADLSGISLDEAIAKLDQRKAEAARLDLIRASSPDLVKLVEEGRMSAADAVAADENRQQQARQAQEAATELLATIIRMLDAGNDGKATGERLMANFNPHLWPADELGEPTSDLFEASAEVLRTCARLRKKQER